MRHREPDNLGRFVLGLCLALALIILCGECSGQVFRDGFESESGPQLPECANDPDPLNSPIGYQQRITSWADAFFGQSYPDIANGGLSPVGSFTFRSSTKPSGPAIAGSYIAIPFTATAGANKVEWYGSQAILSRGYRANKPAHATLVTISECPGDFRMALGHCWAYGKGGSIFHGPVSQCWVQPGKGYYLNIVFADPFAGLAGHTCVDPSGVCNAIFGD